MLINGKVFFLQTYNTDGNSSHKKSTFEIAHQKSMVFNEVLDIIVAVPSSMLLLSYHIPTTLHPKEQYPQIWY